MCKLSGQTGSASIGRVPLFHARLFSGLTVLVLLLVVAAARGAEPDEEYLKIYGHIQEAEVLESSGKGSQALARYTAAFIELKAFQKSHPDWNPKVLNTRLSRLATQIRALSNQPAASPTTTNAPGSNAVAVSAPSANGKGTPTGEPKLLQPGAEPRKVLRLHPKAGDQQTLDLTLKIGMTTKMGPTEGPATKLPGMKLTLQVNVKDVSPQGDITYEMVMSDANVVEEPEALPQMVEFMKAVFSKAKGMSGTGTVSDRGIGKGVEVKVASGADPQSRQLLDQMKEVFSGAILPLPEEPVGPGAKWEVRMANKTEGIQVDQTQAYELISVEGDRLKAKTTVTERAGHQKIQSPTGLVGSVDLVKLAGNGTGDLAYDLTHLLPAAASAAQHRETTMNLGSGTQRQTVTQKMDLNIQVKAREASATPTGTGALPKQSTRR